MTYAWFVLAMLALFVLSFIGVGIVSALTNIANSWAYYLNHIVGEQPLPIDNEQEAS